MKCTHPVLYSRNCVLYCQVCGALIAANTAADKPEGQEKKPPEGPKKPAKRKAAK